MNSPTQNTVHAEQLLDHWQKQQLLTDEGRENIEAHLIEEARNADLPFYMHILAGAGAFIAANFFMGFMFAASLIDLDSAVGMLIWGAIYMAIGFVFIRLSRSQDEELRKTFFLQLSVCAMGLGKVLCVVGLVEAFEGQSGINDLLLMALAIAVVSIPTYILYRLYIDRLISSFAFLILLYSWLMTGRDFSGENMSNEQIIYGTALTVFVCFLMFLVAKLFLSRRTQKIYMPVAYASLAVLTGSLFAKMFMTFPDNHYKYLVDFTFITALLACALIGLMAWAAGGIRKLKTEALIIASIGVIGLAFLSEPGILFALCLMVLGYGKHDDILLTLGAVLLPVFIILYYYSMEITLLAKSGIMIGSGLLLLAGCLYMYLRKLYQPDDHA